MPDQWTKHLADKGYTAISLPGNEFKLLTLVFERGGARGHANSFDSLAPGIRVQLAEPEKNVDLPAIQGERTRSVDLGIGLKVLSGLISSLGVAAIGLDAGFKAARKITFAYDGVTSETLDPVALQIALNAVAIPASGLLRDWLDDHLYVVTSVLRASKISVTAHDESGGEVALDVPAISQAASGKLDATFSGANSSTVTLGGTTPVAFAVTLFQVTGTKDGSKRLTLRTAKEGSVTIKGIAEGDDADRSGPVVLSWDPERQARDEAATASR